jgi:hypothetical protein
MSMKVITIRAILIGTLLAILISAVTPFNDYVAVNTFLVGSFLPLAVSLALCFLLLLVNAPLHRFAPSFALTTGELRVILLMLLVACSVPAQGLFRTFFPTITVPFFFGGDDPVFWAAFLRADLPTWLFPVNSLEEGRDSDIIKFYFSRLPAGQAIPWSAWVAPLAGWGVYVAAWMTSMVSLAWLLRLQWGRNEKLLFPIAQFYNTLLQPPAPGKALGDVFRHWGFWIIVITLLLTHSVNALHAYDERWFEIPLGYDLRPKMADEPWRYIPDSIRNSRLYFTFIAIAFFMRARSSFSMWSIFMIVQTIRASSAANQTPIADGIWADQHVGACIAFVAGLMFVGRAFFGQVFGGALGMKTDPRVIEPSSLWAARALILAVVVMVAWHLAIGMSIWMTVLLIGLMLIAHISTSRIVAETGLPIVRTQADITQVMPSIPASAISPKDAVFGSMMSMHNSIPARESMLGLVQHGLKVAEDSDIPQRWPLKVALIIAWTLVLSFGIAAWSHLTCEYRYSEPLTPRKEFSILNQDIATGHATARIRQPVVQHASGTFSPKPYSPLVQIALGAVIMAVLQGMSLRFSWWPFMPVGYLIVGTVFIGGTWPSLMVGWILKVVVLKFGGPKLFEQVKPVAMGLIFGDALAAGLWVLISLCLALNGYDYIPVQILPT